MGEIGETVGNAMTGLLQRAMQEPEMKDGDYLDEEGLIVCGKCGRHKQKIIKWPGSLSSTDDKIIVRVMCLCQIKEEQDQKKEEEYRDLQQRILKIRSMSLIDDKYRNARFSEYTETKDNQTALRTAKKYVSNFEEMLQNNQGIIFYGPVGTGKSFTAACIANELMEQCIPVVMTSFVKILQRIQNGEEEKVLKALNDAKLLVLDDLGTESNTDYALEKVYNIIDSRNRAALPMILTTNLELSEMMQTPDIRYRRIYDRIFETCYPVNVPGESFRRVEAAMRFDRMKNLIGG